MTKFYLILAMLSTQHEDVLLTTDLVNCVELQQQINYVLKDTDYVSYCIEQETHDADTE